jgi:pimeloyl-ACP methyl ester carboxylesterase
MPQATLYGEAPLDPAIRARVVEGVNGLALHVLEAGRGDAPCVLLLHGFPELAYSWRKVMPRLAQAGYRVLAPDQRGYGRTTGWDAGYDCDLGAYGALNLVRDALGLVHALGIRSVAAVVGHDFGAMVAAWCALLRPDVFRSVALMSAPFAGPPALPSPAGAQASSAAAVPSLERINQELAALDPPRKHYQWYYRTRPANADMHRCPQGVHAFLRAYFHHKSADWKANRPYPLASWTAEEIANMPTYYIMPRDLGMAATVAAEMPQASEIAACRWLTEEELGVYSAEYARTGFQGGLNWYRARTNVRVDAEQQIFAGRSIDVPACFIAGKSDWGTYQRPGDFERMQRDACTRMTMCELVEGAGHWVQQEQPEAVSNLLREFLDLSAAGARVASD